MHEIIKVLKDQLEQEVKSAKEKLTMNNLDTMYKLTSTIRNFECMENGEWKENKDGVHLAAETAENIVKKYSNGRYDHNIDALYDSYIEAKKKYKEIGDQGHRDKLMECVARLMTEVYDMLSSMIIDSDFIDERKAVERQIKILADM